MRLPSKTGTYAPEAGPLLTRMPRMLTQMPKALTRIKVLTRMPKVLTRMPYSVSSSSPFLMVFRLLVFDGLFSWRRCAWDAMGALLEGPEPLNQGNAMGCPTLRILCDVDVLGDQQIQDAALVGQDRVQERCVHGQQGG